jgi:hypothetical protein
MKKKEEREHVKRKEKSYFIRKKKTYQKETENADLIQVLKRIFHISNHFVVNGKIVQFGVVPRVGLQKC